MFSIARYPFCFSNRTWMKMLDIEFSDDVEVDGKSKHKN